jgi:pimeloyl-ACP methyl ester carboxylesterase
MLNRSTKIVAVFATGLFQFCGAGFGQAPDRLPQAPPPAVATLPLLPVKKLPTPQNISLKRTRDGVQLSATFYPSKLEKEMQKEAVPVILLHPYKGSRIDCAGLAVALQGSGCAVLVPDLRGHGQSTRRLMSDGQEKELESSLFIRQDFDAMAAAEQDGGGDVEVCKSFLMTKNNSQELNIDKLCIVGAEMGASVAINWTAKDWSWPILAGAGKQGQFVKALVLLSPQWSFKGMPIGAAVGNREFVAQLSWMIVVGEQDSKAFGEAKRLNQSLERYLPAFTKAQGKPSVNFRPLSTSLQGAKLLTTPGLASEIVRFIDLQVGKSAHAWTEYKSPL